MKESKPRAMRIRAAEILSQAVGSEALGEYKGGKAAALGSAQGVAGPRLFVAPTTFRGGRA